MADPIKQRQREEEQYVSPISDETPQERYQRILDEEAQLTEAEIAEKIKRLDAPSDLFDWEGNE
jgi:hypothetical protein